METTEQPTTEPDEIEPYSEHISLRRFGGSEIWSAVDNRDGATTAVAYGCKGDLVWALDHGHHFFRRPYPHPAPDRLVVSMASLKIHRGTCRFVPTPGSANFPFANPLLVDGLAHCKVCKP